MIMIAMMMIIVIIMIIIVTVTINRIILPWKFIRAETTAFIEVL